MQAYLETRSALVRMIDPGAMGRFRVLVFGRDLPDDVEIPGLRPVAGAELPEHATPVDGPADPPAAEPADQGIRPADQGIGPSDQGIRAAD